MLNEKQKQGYLDFAKSMADEVLDSRTSYLVRMATAMALSCYP